MDIKVTELRNYQSFITVPGINKKYLLNWAKPNKHLNVYRASQPFYDISKGEDTLHTFPMRLIKWLMAPPRNIRLIVSLNHHPIDPTTQTYFDALKVKFIHVRTPDFGVPDMNEIRDACEFMKRTLDRDESVLIYCGYGQGRTGTMYSAFEVFDMCRTSRETTLDQIIAQSTAETSGQEKMLRALSTLAHIPFPAKRKSRMTIYT